MSRTLSLAALASLALAAPSFAQVATTTRAAAPPPAAGLSDPTFAAALSASNLAEIAAAKIALTRASAPEVKEYAQKMIEEHTQANRELTQLAASKQVPVSRALEVKDAAAGEILMGLSGEEFDLAYVKNQVAGHMCAYALVECYAKKGNDPDMKALAAKLAPKVKDHLMMAKKMYKEEKEVEKEHKSAAK